MANEKNITTVRDEDKSFIRVIMSLPPEKKKLIQGIIIGLDLQEKQTATAADVGNKHLQFNSEERK